MENSVIHNMRINCLFLDVIEGQMTEVKGVGRRTTQGLDDLETKKGVGS